MSFVATSLSFLLEFFEFRGKTGSTSENIHLRTFCVIDVSSNFCRHRQKGCWGCLLHCILHKLFELIWGECFVHKRTQNAAFGLKQAIDGGYGDFCCLCQFFNGGAFKPFSSKESFCSASAAGFRKRILCPQILLLLT